MNDNNNDKKTIGDEGGGGLHQGDHWSLTRGDRIGEGKGEEGERGEEGVEEEEGKLLQTGGMTSKAL